MSVISNRHSITGFIAGKSVPFEGQRLSKVGYKNTLKNPARFPSVCVSVPMITEEEITNNFDRLIPYIRALAESAQDGIVKSLYESSEGTFGEVSDSDIDMNSVIGYLENEASGGRLTKEFLNSWFDANMSDNLTVVIAGKLFGDIENPNSEQEKTIEKHVKVYKELISSLSGGATILQPTQIAAVRNGLRVASVEDEVSKKLLTRLVKMETPVKVEDMIDLG